MEKDDIAFHTPFLEVVRRDVVDTTGSVSPIHFTRTRPAVIVFVRTTDGRILLQDQYVYVHGARVLGCVAGYMDDGETPEQTAVRELQEESGYAAERVVSLGSAFAGKWADTVYHYMFADHAVPRGAPELEPLEDIRTVLVSVEECAAYLLSNPYIDTPTLVCLQRGLSYIHAI
jgi:ADP-ribose pyrophosphatase